jgi:hypothetical protein
MTITMLSTEGFLKNMVMVVNGKNYRIIEVISQTQVRVDRPWWMWLSLLAWSLARAYRRLFALFGY